MDAGIGRLLAVLWKGLGSILFFSKHSHKDRGLLLSGVVVPVKDGQGENSALGSEGEARELEALS